MAYTVLVHVAGEEAILAEIDELPKPTDVLITIENPRRRDGKDLPYIQPEVTTVVWMLHNISFIELMPSGADDELITFVRE